MHTGVDLQNVVCFFDHFSFFFKTNGTKANTCGDVKMCSVKWVLIVMGWHIHRLQGEQSRWSSGCGG
jgi:hypothetical protein